MSEESLQRFLDRLNNDPAFAEKVKGDWDDVIDEANLSPAELAAFGTQDEDALRRLAGSEVQAHWFGTISCTGFCTYGCRPTDTAGSGKGCGTGPRGTGCCGTPGSGQGCGTGGNCGGVVAQ